MKITGQNVPPELQAAYDGLVSPAKKGQGDTGTIYTKRSVRANNPNSLAKGARTAIDRIIEGLARACGRTAHTLANDYWRQQRTIELMDGKINPAYWIEAEVLRQDTYQVSGIGAEELPRPPYKFETPNNRPTNTTWQGVIDALGNPTYSGSLQGTLFRDDTWAYRRTIAMLNEPIDDLAATAAFAYYSGEIKIDTDRRGSRAMCSLMSLVEVVETTDQLTSPPRPPVAPSTSLYWRYKTPVATPPYYHIRQPRRVLQQVPRVAEKARGSIMSVTLGTRPMAGHANNNNTTVTTEWIGTEKIYTVKPCGGAERLPVFAARTATGSTLYSFDHMTGRLTQWRDFLDPMTVISGNGETMLVRHPDYTTSLYSAALNEIATFDRPSNPHVTSEVIWPYQGGYAAQWWEPVTPNIHFIRATWNKDGSIRAETDVLMPSDNPGPDTEYSWQQWNTATWPYWLAPNGYIAADTITHTSWFNPNGYNCAYLTDQAYAATRTSYQLYNSLGKWLLLSPIDGPHKILFWPWPYSLVNIAQPQPVAPHSIYDPPARIAMAYAGEYVAGYPFSYPICAALDQSIFFQCENGTAWVMDHLGNFAETNPMDGELISTRFRACDTNKIGAIPR
jgi:hypothetical protein